MDPISQIRRAAFEAQTLLNGLYAVGEPAIGSALDQAGLRDGSEIVDDYLEHGEAGVALEHLLYMITEVSLKLSADSCADIRGAAESLGMAQYVNRRNDTSHLS